jgi:all-trans-retinol 13,14-reductase
VTTHYDDLIIGSGMAGLAVASLLAASGRRVGLLEAHDQPGGYAHTFSMREYRFCAQVHYVFGGGEGETLHVLLSRLGLAEKVPFVRLDPEGFDHVIVAGERTRIPNGLGTFERRLARRFPESARALARYFEVISTLGRELDGLRLPSRTLSLETLRAAIDARHVLYYQRWTLQDLYDHLHLPIELQAILAGQSGDYLLPPRDVSLLLHASLVTLYDRGAYYPRNHYAHFVESLADAVRSRPGCGVHLEHEVTRIHTEGSRVVGVSCANGARFSADRYVSNVDPRATARLADTPILPAQRSDYAYSAGTITLYLGLRGIDLREHGFGSFNVWHYPHADLNRIYDRQLEGHDLSDPWLFLSTPTLHSDAPGLCPAGDQILEVATACDYRTFAELRRQDRRAYNRLKQRTREQLLDVIETHYVPKLRDHLVMRVTGTPATNERFCRAPEGNSYGARLDPRNVGRARGPHRSLLRNLWFANATAGFPSVAGAASAGMKLYEILNA